MLMRSFSFLQSSADQLIDQPGGSYLRITADNILLLPSGQVTASIQRNQKQVCSAEKRRHALDERTIAVALRPSRTDWFPVPLSPANCSHLPLPSGVRLKRHGAAACHGY